jgi:hypothetical protein
LRSPCGPKSARAALNQLPHRCGAEQAGHSCVLPAKYFGDDTRGAAHSGVSASDWPWSLLVLAESHFHFHEGCCWGNFVILCASSVIAVIPLARTARGRTRFGGTDRFTERPSNGVRHQTPIMSNTVRVLAVGSAGEALCPQRRQKPSLSVRAVEVDETRDRHFARQPDSA